MSTRNPTSGFNPTLKLSEFAALANFFKEFLAENKGIRWSIYAAGVAAIFEIGRTFWLMIRYFAKF